MSDDRAVPPLPLLPPPPPKPPSKQRNKDEDGGVITTGRGNLAKKGAPLPPPRSNSPEYQRARREEHLTEESWRQVYLAFADSGDPKVIAAKVKLPTRDVKHLLDFGLIRFGLPSVRAVATDKDAVNLKVKELIDEATAQALVKVKEEDPEVNLQQNPDVRSAVVDRAVRETAGAQAALIASVGASDVLVGYINTLMTSIKQGTSNFAIPEEVTPGFLETLSKAINNLTTATGKAIEQSRLTAGEPTQNVAVHIASFTASLSKEELHEYVKTGVVPSHLRVRGGSRDSAIKPAPVIDVKAEPND